MPRSRQDGAFLLSVSVKESGAEHKVYGQKGAYGPGWTAGSTGERFQAVGGRPVPQVALENARGLLLAPAVSVSAILRRPHNKFARLAGRFLMRRPYPPPPSPIGICRFITPPDIFAMPIEYWDGRETFNLSRQIWNGKYGFWILAQKRSIRIYNSFSYERFALQYHNFKIKKHFVNRKWENLSFLYSEILTAANMYFLLDCFWLFIFDDFY